MASAHIQRMLGLLPNPNPIWEDVVFVAVDTETWTKDNTRVSEVGIAVLDTRDLKGLNDTRQFISKFKYAHYRPVKEGGCENRKYVGSCPWDFNFGNTTWVNGEDLPTILERIFQDPGRLHEAATFTVPFENQKRNIVYLEHGDGLSDQKALKKLGFDLRIEFSDWPEHNVCSKQNLALLTGHRRGKPRSLIKIAIAVGLQPENLHNAGNDAAYELQALVMIAAMDLVTPGEVWKALEALGEETYPPSGFTYTEKRAWHLIQGTVTRKPGAQIRKENERNAWRLANNTIHHPRRVPNPPIPLIQTLVVPVPVPPPSPKRLPPPKASGQSNGSLAVSKTRPGSNSSQGSNSTHHMQTRSSIKAEPKRYASWTDAVKSGLKPTTVKKPPPVPAVPGPTKRGRNGNSGANIPPLAEPPESPKRQRRATPPASMRGRGGQSGRGRGRDRGN